MIPFLLLLFLLQIPSEASIRNCKGRSACLYFTTCYVETEGEFNTTMMIPAVNATVSLEEAVKEKDNCVGRLLISNLSIISTSFSSLKVSFETDLNEVGFALGTEPNTSVVEFYSTNNTGDVYMNGIGKVTDLSKLLSLASVGRAIYSFRLEIPEKKHRYAFFDEPISFVMGATSKQRFDFEIPEFWNDLKSKLACDVKLIHDSCNAREECEKVLIDSQSLSCEQPGQLHVKPNSSEWEAVTSVSCHDDQWRFISSSGTIYVQSSEEIDVLCLKPSPNYTSQPMIGKQASTAFNAKSETPFPKIEKPSLIGNKWILVGGCGLLILIIGSAAAIWMIERPPPADSPLSCGICLYHLTIKRTSIFDCGHEYHTTCALDWLERCEGRSTCPSCRREVRYLDEDGYIDIPFPFGPDGQPNQVRQDARPQPQTVVTLLFRTLSKLRHLADVETDAIQRVFDVVYMQDIEDEMAKLRVRRNILRALHDAIYAHPPTWIPAMPAF